MPLPFQLPTDTLSKFRALSGLALLMATFWVAAARGIAVRGQLDTAEQEMQVQWVELDHLLEDEHAVRTGTLTGEAAQKVREARRSYDTRSAALTVQIRRNVRDAEELVWFFFLAVAGAVVGLTISIRGFRDWHRKEADAPAPEASSAGMLPAAA